MCIFHAAKIDHLSIVISYLLIGTTKNMLVDRIHNFCSLDSFLTVSVKWFSSILRKKICNSCILSSLVGLCMLTKGKGETYFFPKPKSKGKFLPCRDVTLSILHFYPTTKKHVGWQAHIQDPSPAMGQGELRPSLQRLLGTWKETPTGHPPGNSNVLSMVIILSTWKCLGASNMSVMWPPPLRFLLLPNVKCSSTIKRFLAPALMQRMTVPIHPLVKARKFTEQYPVLFGVFRCS